jgi:hypothetical protein
VELVVGGRKQKVARFYVGKAAGGFVNLQTNRSMNSFVEPVLKGMKIVDDSVVSGKNCL